MKTRRSFAFLTVFIVLTSIASGTAEKLPGLTFEREDVRLTNYSITRCGTGQAVLFWLSPHGQQKLDDFGKTNFQKQVLLRYTPNVTVTSMWRLQTLTTPKWYVVLPSQEEAIAFQRSVGLADDLRLRFGKHFFGLLETPLGRTGVFIGGGSPVWNVSASARKCTLVALGALAIPVLLIVSSKTKARG
jgi:hypothetical protein